MKFAIVLSGCGVYDGSEIHEATLSMLAIRNNNCEYDVFAPNIDQYHVINHLTGNNMDEKRNVLIESARIARGDISNLKEFNSNNYDVLLFPGGFGAAKNLSNYAIDSSISNIDSDVKKAILDMYQAKKIIVALCIAPVVIAKVLGNKIKITIGNDKETANHINNMGAKHISTDKHGVVIDKENKIISGACYMLTTDIKDVYIGINNIVKEVKML